MVILKFCERNTRMTLVLHTDDIFRCIAEVATYTTASIIRHVGERE